MSCCIAVFAGVCPGFSRPFLPFAEPCMIATKLGFAPALRRGLRLSLPRCCAAGLGLAPALFAALVSLCLRFVLHTAGAGPGHQCVAAACFSSRSLVRWGMPRRLHKAGSSMHVAYPSVQCMKHGSVTTSYEQKPEISVCRWQDCINQGLINAPAPPPSHAASPAAPRAQPHCRATGATAAALSATLLAGTSAGSKAFLITESPQAAAGGEGGGRICNASAGSVPAIAPAAEGG